MSAASPPSAGPRTGRDALRHRPGLRLRGLRATAAEALRGVPRDQIVVATKGGLRPPAAVSPATPARPGSARASTRACGARHRPHRHLPAALARPDHARSRTPPRRSPSWSPSARSATSACPTSTSGRWRPSAPPCRSRRCSPPTTCSAGPSRRRSSPTPTPTTSASWSTDPSPTGCSAATSNDTRFAPATGEPGARFPGAPSRATSPRPTSSSSLAELGITLRQLAVAWTLANPAVHVAIVGTRDPRHVDEAVAAADIVLEPEVLGRITRSWPARTHRRPVPGDERTPHRNRKAGPGTDFGRSAQAAAQVAVIGAGTMGPAMARRLLAPGWVWTCGPGIDRDDAAGRAGRDRL